MKHIALPAVLALALGTSLAFAQAPVVRQIPAQDQASAAQQQAPMTAPNGHHRHPHDPNKEAAHLARKLNLNAAQQSKLAAAFADRDQKMQALHQNTALEQQDMRKQSHRIRKETMDQVASFLTPDQLEQLKSMQHEHGPHGPRGNSQPINTPPAA